MATLVFSALGTVVGGPLGGAIGALLGRQVDSMIIGSPSREGPRLKELTATTSSYGSVLARHFGRMRVAGTIIWATDLVEHRNTQGGGKGRPSVTSYAYSASFAVALASRPLLGVGRIWADGNLLRGAAGDLKAGGTMRFYPGWADQTPDPLIAAAQAPLPCPAFRGIAYVVFEDLQLADFGNRIPALTFEVIADDGTVYLESLAGKDVAALSSTLELNDFVGLSQEGSVAETLSQLLPVIPQYFDVNSGKVRVVGEQGGGAVALREPSVAAKDNDFGGRSGFSAKRARSPDQVPAALRYYDVDRDFQPGVQRASGPVQAGQPSTVEVPVALEAGPARGLIEALARRADWSRQTVLWRTSEVDPAWRPGALVTIPGIAGIWRVMSWEWRASGVELGLARTPFSAAPLPLSVAVDTGQAAVAPDRAIGPTWLQALELPWDGTGAGDLPLVRAAVSSGSSGWAGAAMFLDDGDGQLQPLGGTGRVRATVGSALSVLPAASALVADRSTSLDVELLDAEMTLADATMRQLAMGANRALVGSEIVQFARATPLGDRQWRLHGLLRGRGGTEQEITAHGPSELFVLLDDRLFVIDGALVGQNSQAGVDAIGSGDAAPVHSAIVGRGLTQRPLFPVHPKAHWTADGSLELRWTRRARAAWAWRDQVDTPLHEQAEIYEVLLGPEDAPLAMWITSEPSIVISAAQVAALAAAHPGQAFLVRQRGSYARSASLLLTHLT